jgi:hypothetical protein
MVDLSSIFQALAAVAASLNIYEFFSKRNVIQSMWFLKKLYGVDKSTRPQYILPPSPLTLSS